MHGNAAASHACHCRLEVPAAPLWLAALHSQRPWASLRGIPHAGAVPQSCLQGCCSPCSHLVWRVQGIRTVLWPRPGSGREEMPPGRAPPTASILPSSSRGASRHCSQHRYSTGPCLSLQHSGDSAGGQKKEDLLHTCFTSIFWLPPKEDMQGLDTSLYHKVSTVINFDLVL